MSGRFSTCIKYWFFLPLSLFIFLLISPAICVEASDYGDFYYYGPIYNSYKNYSQVDVTEYSYTSSVFCFVYYYRDSPYICVAIPDSLVKPSPSNSRLLGIYRRRMVCDFDGYKKGYVAGEFFQVNYGSTLLVVHDGQLFNIRRMTVNDVLIYDCPVFISDIVPEEGIELAFKSYYDGVMAYSSGGSLTGDLQVISDNLVELKDNTVTVSEIRVFVSLCFMVLSAILFRGILSQWVRNVVR